MDLHYSRHGEERLEQQGITQAMVEAVLLDQRWTPATSRNKRYDAMIGDRRLCVVVAEEN